VREAYVVSGVKRRGLYYALCESVLYINYVVVTSAAIASFYKKPPFFRLQTEHALPTPPLQRLSARQLISPYVLHILPF